MTRREVWMLFAVGAVGLAARATRLTESLWYDEIAAWHDYGRLGPVDIVTTYHDPANHVAHTLLTWCSESLTGAALGPEVALRLPALVFSLLSIIAVYGLARAVAGGRVGLLAAAVTAVAPVAVLEGADARGYSMMIFFGAATTWLLVRGLVRGPVREPEARGAWRWVAYAVACALGVWTHLMTVFVPVGHAVVLIVLAARGLRDGRGDGRRVPWRAFAAIGGAALLTLALYAPILDDIARVRREFAGADGSGPSVFGPEGLHALLQLGGAWAWWAALPGLALAAIGLSRAREPRVALAVALAGAGLPIVVLLAVVTDTWLYARFLLFAFPASALLVALGIDTLWRRHASAGRLAVVVLVAAGMTDLLGRPPRQPLREAADYVATRMDEGDRVLVVGLRHAVLDVYAGRLDVEFSLLHGNDLDAKLVAVAPAWVVVLYPASVPADRITRLTDGGYGRVRRLDGWIDWGNGDIEIWRKHDPASSE